MMKKGKLKFGCGLGLIFAALIVLVPFVKEQMIPELLRNSRNENAAALRFDAESAQAVVFYPKDTEAEFVTGMAEYIRDDLKGQSYASLNIKVDFRKSQSGNLMFLWFDAVDENGTLLKVYSGICDVETHQSLKVSDLMQDTFYELVSSELRYQCKESGVLKDAAYTSEFYEATSPSALKEMEFYMDEETAEAAVTILLQGKEVLLSAEIAVEDVYRCMREDQVLYQSGSLVHPLRHYVDKDRPMVALTFDDGPVRKNTLQALESLKTYDARATFFMLGFRMERNPDVVLDVLNAGNEVGSHTYDHADLTAKKTNLSYQYTKNQVILSEITQSEAEIQLLRPPYGAMNQSVKSTSPYPLIMWSLDTLDWKTLDAQATHETIMENVQDGDIILLHDLHESSVQSLATVLPALVDAGYQIVTVSELMEARGIEMQNGISYSKARK